MFKIKRFVSFYIDILIGMGIAFFLSVSIGIAFSLLKIKQSILIFIYVMSFFYFIYLLIIKRNYILNEGQSIGQKIFCLQVMYKGDIANEKICKRKNTIDLFTFSFGIFTVIFFNKSVGDLLIGTYVERKNN